MKISANSIERDEIFYALKHQDSANKVSSAIIYHLNPPFHQSAPRAQFSAAAAAATGMS